MFIRQFLKAIRFYHWKFIMVEVMRPWNIWLAGNVWFLMPLRLLVFIVNINTISYSAIKPQVIQDQQSYVQAYCGGRSLSPRFHKRNCAGKDNFESKKLFLCRKDLKVSAATMYLIGQNFVNCKFSIITKISAMWA